MSEMAFWLHADQRTIAALNTAAEKVLLLGGYLGYVNFGDVLQLKGAIAFHRAHGNRTPVVVLDAAALMDEDHAERIRSWFGVEALLFWSSRPVDLSPLGLHVLRDVPPVADMHLYGGGFLTSQWGHSLLQLAECLLSRFQVGRYVISGQQVDSSLADRLRHHAATHRPVLAGGRDPASVEVLQSCGMPAELSFDDATEMLQEFGQALRLSHREPADGGQVLLHMNAASYARAGTLNEGLRKWSSNLEQVAAWLHETVPDGAMEVTLLQGYADRRVTEVLDTVAVVQQLAEDFVFPTTRLVDLARLSLQFGTSQWQRPRNELRGWFALANSYHVTLLMLLGGIPVHIDAENAYYRQKRDGLGFAGQDLGTFLRRRDKLSLEGRLEARAVWQAKMQQVYGQSASSVKSNASAAGDARLVSLAPDAVNIPWQSKPGIAELQSAMARLETQYEQAHQRVLELEAEKNRIWQDAQQVSSGWEAQRAHLAELEGVRDRMWAELGEMKANLEAARAQEAQLRELIGQLQEEVSTQSTRAAQVREKRIYRLLRKLGALPEI